MEEGNQGKKKTRGRRKQGEGENFGNEETRGRRKLGDEETIGRRKLQEGGN